ncbi:hypothetical protein [Acidianus bottle-shaped virus]|uniref:Uncharacterized protein n=1 Tax=Acidianus bottle-shaped virus (isolate Italy/Pozzuoli) TaxID=654911 RepID=A4ZUB7_ABVP|nr:hypothetical protein ABV_gp31 [Acidianus bottle-shaped virus]ABP73421.1 hypothetical protein [Acidianus bottle-shaped virus]
MEPIHFKCEKVIRLFYPDLFLCLDDYPGAGYAFTRPPLEVIIDKKCPEGWEKKSIYFSPYVLCTKLINRPVELTYERNGKFYHVLLQ